MSTIAKMVGSDALLAPGTSRSANVGSANADSVSTIVVCGVAAATRDWLELVLDGSVARAAAGFAGSASSEISSSPQPAGGVALLFRRRGRVEEPDRDGADRDEVAVLQLELADLAAVDERAVARAHVLDEPAPLLLEEAAVVARGLGDLELDLVLGEPACLRSRARARACETPRYR